MKLLRFATIAALSSTILTGGAISAFAEEAREVKTDGQIQFTAPTDEDGELEVIPPIDPDEDDAPDVELDPEIDGTTGPLSIMKAATMNFGSQVISNQDQVYDMVAEMQQLRGTEGDENKVPYVSFAQVQDLRGTNEGWNLQVRLSDFESGTQNNQLTGAEITFVDHMLRYDGSNQANAPEAHEEGMTLMPDGAARPVMTAAQGKGAGTSSVVWGNQADLNAQFADETIEVVKNNAIQLFIPGTTAKDAATYESTLTWELTATPSEEGPGTDA
ncbi:WxL domain-containing protein [Enterococcus casseliflavus]|uniref:WxL domain-containing protein n=1 Tax=Enterococcus casseliflavus TaxID=37734 RepID=UPI0039A624E4